MIKVNPYSDWALPLYPYLARSYAGFLTWGKCLNFPRAIQIQTQSRCNAQCSICPYPVTSKTLQHGVMEYSLFEKIINELAAERQAPLFMFALHNEPLMDNRIFEWIKQAKKINPKLYCILPTNGAWLDRFSLQEIKQSALDQINLSLHAGSEEVYRQINPILDFNKITQNVFHLLSDASLRQTIQMMFLLNSLNAHEIKEATQFWKRKGVRTKVIQISNRAGSLDTYKELVLKETLYRRPLHLRLWKNLMSTIRGATGCELPFYQMNILFNGDVIVCSYDWKRTTVIGNIKTDSLRSIWNCERINAVRRNLIAKRYERISACSGCSIVNRDVGLTKQDTGSP